MLREAMNRGVTTTYIDEALTSLKAITQSVQNWSVVKWAIFSAVVIYLLMPLYTAYGDIWFNDMTGRVYLTPLLRWDNQHNLLTSLEILARYCGLFIAIVAIAIAFLGYLWRRGWVRWRMGQHLAKWAVNRKILRSGWFMSFILTSLLTTSLLLFFPIWVTNEGELFGQYSIIEFIRWGVQFIK
jgi:hypothetical protein